MNLGFMSLVLRTVTLGELHLWLYFTIIQNSRGCFGFGGDIAVKRYLEDHIIKDLEKKMVFIGGPRQVGKTTIAKAIISRHFAGSVYLNWDIDEDRRAILAKEWRQDAPLVVFDELHKYPKWKQWIKGLYDSTEGKQKILVTGSARMDTYKKGGDSLLGRYHYWRLHPLTIGELPKDIKAEDAYNRLLEIGGFPEPFLENNEREARRWRKERFDRILREDVRDLDHIKNIQMLSLFIDALRQRAGSLITISNVARDLEISPKTAKSWLELAEKMYMLFSIYPYTDNLARSIQKPPKVFFYDNADTLSDAGARLENLVATHLLKYLNYIEDYEGYRCSLHYIRDRDNREVDFLTVIDGKPTQLIEVKLSDSKLSRSLKYYKEKIAVKHTFQIVGHLKRCFHKDDIFVCDPLTFFASLEKYCT